MKTLLVPTDFSPISKNALAYAVGLAEKLDAKITLLHAYHLFPINIDANVMIKEFNDEVELYKRVSEVQLKELSKDIEQTTTCKCDYVSFQGLAKDVIVEYANEIKPDLLVIGTENLMPIERLIYGTVTGKVIKDVECTVMVIPESVKYTTPKKIAFAMDYHDSDVDEIRFVEELAKKFKSETHIIHVISNEEDEAFEEDYFIKTEIRIKKNVSKNHTVFRLIKGDTITKELKKYIAEKHIDVLSVAKTKKSFLEQLFSTSVSQKMFYSTNIPLLIFKATDTTEDFI